MKEGSKAVVANSRLHVSPGSYEASVRKRVAKTRIEDKGDGFAFTHEGAPTAISTAVEFHGSDEHEYSRKDGRHVSVNGRAVCGNVEWVGSDLYPSASRVVADGHRFLVLPITPDALGGRLQLLSQDYAHHRFKKLRFYYVPAIGTQTDGTLLMYYSPDPSLSTFPTGSDEVAHAFATSAGVSDRTWMPLAYTVEPSDAYKQYVDAGAGNNAQGIVVLEAAVGLDFSNYTSTTLGTLYVDYECEFSQPNLSYQVPSRPSAYVEFNTTAVTGSLNATAFVGKVGTSGLPVISTNYFGCDISSFPPGVAAASELQDWVLTLTMGPPFETATPANPSLDWAVRDPQLDLLKNLTGGETFFLRFGPLSASTDMIVLVFTSYADALDYDTNASSSPIMNALQWQTVNWTTATPSSICANGLWTRLD